jgi:serine/threonine-protein kinase
MRVSLSIALSYALCVERPLEPTAARIGRYEVIRKIGAGGMGEVYLARAIGPGGIEKQVCIKRTLAGRSMNAGAFHRFLEEARTVLALQHANVVPVFDFGRDAAGLYLVMEWIDGCDLAALLAAERTRRQALPPVIAAYLAAEVCKALSYAHERTDGAGRPAGILHRDVTPRNILLSRLGEVRVTDFGIARAITATGAATGTPAYMAPEEARGGAADGRSDLYSLGLILGEMLLGQPLRAGGSRQDARLAVPVPGFAGVPEDIAAVARRLLAPEPADRFPSAAAAHAALMVPLAREILRGGTVPALQLANRVGAVATPAPQTAKVAAGTEAGATEGPAVPHGPSGWRRAVALALFAGAAGLLAWGFAHRAANDRPSRSPAPARSLAGPPPRAAPVPVAPVPPAPPPPAPPDTRASKTLRPARLRIKAPGSWLTVYLDDRKLADDAGEFDIPAGRHRLRVENPPLHYMREEWIAARPGETLTREFTPER